MTDTTFPCPACGGPIDPLPGTVRMACPYCSSQATIPANLRKQAAPPPPDAATVQMQSPPPSRPAEPEIDMAEVLRKAQPVAAAAVTTVGAWAFLRKLAPGCLIAISILCVLACVAAGALANYVWNMS